MLIDNFLAVAVGRLLQRYSVAFTAGGYGDTHSLARSSREELTAFFVRAGVEDAHRRLIEETLVPLQQQARAELPAAVAATPQSQGSGAGFDNGVKTYDAVFDRQEKELGVRLERVATDGRLRLEVRTVIPGSMAESAGVQVYDELVAYRAAGVVGAPGWHKIGFSRPTEDFVREVGECHRPCHCDSVGAESMGGQIQAQLRRRQGLGRPSRATSGPGWQQLAS
jgi:hypothetical protein